MMITGVAMGLPLLLANAAVDDGSRIAYLALSDGFWQVWVMAGDGSGKHPVTETTGDKTRVSWFPDGKRLLVNSLEGRAFIVDLSTNAQTPVSLPLAGFEDAVISPDGKRVAFSLSTSGAVDDHNIWVANVDGTSPRKLTTLPWLQHWPSWSHNGQNIYFASGKGDQTHDIWTVNFLDGQAKQLTANRLYHFDVVEAPNGDLAFSGNQSGNYEIWIRSSDGSERQVTDDPALDAKPTWSPDGKSLAFESSTGGSLGIWRIDLENGSRVRLTPPEIPSRFPVWQGAGETP